MLFNFELVMVKNDQEKLAYIKYRLDITNISSRLNDHISKMVATPIAPSISAHISFFSNLFPKNDTKSKKVRIGVKVVTKAPPRPEVPYFVPSKKI